MISPDQSVFPIVVPEGDYHLHGIDLRTWMATQFMAGILSSNECGISHVPETAAEWSVSCADALIAELNKPKP